MCMSEYNYMFTLPKLHRNYLHLRSHRVIYCDLKAALASHLILVGDDRACFHLVVRGEE